jgi:hypothetical protein
VGIFGEDVYLSSQMGVATVEGFEGKDVGSKYNVFLSETLHRLRQHNRKRQNTQHYP